MKPIEVNDVLLAFPGSVAHLMPDYDSIPDLFKRRNSWSDTFGELFFNENKNNIGLIPMQGIEPHLAWRHLSCILRSYEPKHEHKEAACCYLLDAWFVDALVDFKHERGIYKSLVTGEQVEIT